MASEVQEQLMNVLRSCMKDDTDIPISAASLAYCAMDVLDPEKLSPNLVAYGCNMELRQMARAILRREFEPSIGEEPQDEMFEGLQERYPVKRFDEDGESVLLYAPRMQLTLDERYYNIERMQKQIDGRQKQLDAFMAETVSLQDSGFFSDNG
jgi:hypothetical protein